MSRYNEVANSIDIMFQVTDEDYTERIAWILKDISVTLAKILDVLEGDKNDDESRE